MPLKKKTTTAKKSSGGNSSFDIESFLRKNKTKMKEAVSRAKEDDGGFPSYDDGRYRFQLVKAEANKSQAGRPQVLITYKFKDGDYKGKEYRAYRGIDSEDNMFYFLQDVKRLGYDMDDFDPSEFADLLKQMSKDKPLIMGNLKTKEGKDGNEYQNLQINRVIDGDEDEDEDDEEEDDDAPKKKSKKSKSKADDDDDDDEEEEAEEETEDDDEEEEKPKKKSSKKKSSKDDDDDDEEEEEEEEEDDEEEAPKKKKGKKKPATDEDDDEEEEADDEEEEDDDDEEVPVTVGSIVKVKLKAGTVRAEVTDIMEDDNALKVKTKDGKIVKCSADKIVSVEEPPKKKKTKK